MIHHRCFDIRVTNVIHALSETLSQMGLLKRQTFNPVNLFLIFYRRKSHKSAFKDKLLKSNKESSLFKWSRFFRFVYNMTQPIKISLLKNVLDILVHMTIKQLFIFK
jgi:hypothetical protein